MPDPIHVVIADDHPILRDGLRKLLEAEDDFAVVGIAVDGHEAVEITRRTTPNILLLDLSMPGMPGLEVLRELRQTPLPTRTLVLTASIDRDEIVTAMKLGARGLVMKHSATELLMKAMRTVMAGQYWIGRESVGEIVETLQADADAATEQKFGLTPRELEIVSAVKAGLSNREIATQFGVSPETVKHHLSKIFDKLGVVNRLELALFAISHHLIDR
jgi:two-component system, NarL family, nitrate/nitrite response regulator NarL